MINQKTIERLNKLYNKIVLDEFQNNKDFSVLASKFSSEKSDVTNGYLPTTLKPRFNTEEQQKNIKKYTETIISCLRKIEKSLMEGNSDLKNFMGLSDRELEILKYPKNYKNSYPFVRFDATLNDKIFKIIEINLNFPGGPGAIDALSDKFSKLSSLKKLSNYAQIKPERGFDLQLYKLLIKYYKEAGHTEKKPNILILRWSDYDVTLDTDNLAIFFQKNGCKTMIADPRDVVYKNGKLIYKKFEANLVLKWFDLDIFIDREKECGDIISAIIENKIVMINPLNASVMATKTAFGAMTSQQFKYLFSAKENQILKKCVPWTRLFGNYISDIANGEKVNLVDYAKKNKNQIILKPAVGTCGKDVYVGISFNQEDWNKQIFKITKDKRRYIVQERVEIKEELFPLIQGDKLIFEKRRVDILPMLFDGKYFASWSRCASGYILNGYQGGIIGLNYVIKKLKNNTHE